MESQRLVQDQASHAKGQHAPAARDGFTTSLGVIAATLGSAVGLGNIWKFPFLTRVQWWRGFSGRLPGQHAVSGPAGHGF